MREGYPPVRDCRDLSAGRRSTRCAAVVSDSHCALRSTRGRCVHSVIPPTAASVTPMRVSLPHGTFLRRTSCFRFRAKWYLTRTLRVFGAEASRAVISPTGCPSRTAYFLSEASCFRFRAKSSLLGLCFWLSEVYFYQCIKLHVIGHWRFYIAFVSDKEIIYSAAYREPVINRI